MRIWHRVDLPLVAILLLGFALRVWSIRFGLPYMYHPDEGVPVGIALRMIQTGNLDPQFFNWPSLLMYLNALVYLAYFALGRLAGVFTTPAELPPPDVVIMAVGKAALPEELVLGRGLTVVFGTLSILWVYQIARHFGKDRITPYVAALLLAVDAVNVKHSQFIRPDTFAVFFLLLTVLFALKIADEPRLKYYLLGGAAAGLAASSKYNYAIGFIAILVAHLLLFGVRGLFRKELIGAVLAAILAFVITTPFAILDPQRFLQIGVLDDARIYATGHPGAAGDSFTFYANFLWSTEGAPLLLALASVIWIVWKRERMGWVLVSFPALYFVFINLYTTHFDTTILPVISFIVILAAWSLCRLFHEIADRWRGPRILPALTLSAVLILLVYSPLSATVANDVHLLQPDGREYARQWINVNLPVGSRIAVEAYSPYVDRARFSVEGFYGLQEHTPAWYLENGFEYLVLSREMYGRYLVDPTRYPEEVSNYNALFSQFQPVATFDQNGFEIRVLKTNVPGLPSHRVAAYFGDYADVVELVGYDQIVQWRADAPLVMRLYWRMIESQREPLELEARLIGKDGQEIGKIREDLYQGAPMTAGIVSGDWTIPTTDQPAPGLYHVELNVFQARYAYRAPVKISTEEPKDSLTIGPLKMFVTIVSEPTGEQADVRWNDGISLHGYSLPSQPIRAGDPLLLTFNWQATSKPSRDYTLFVHVLDDSGRVVAQIDAPPLKGDYPTTIWDQGEIIADSVALNLPAELDPGMYRVEIGWYELASLARLPLSESNDQVPGDHWVLQRAIQVIR